MARTTASEPYIIRKGLTPEYLYRDYFGIKWYRDGVQYGVTHSTAPDELTDEQGMAVARGMFDAVQQKLDALEPAHG